MIVKREKYLDKIRPFYEVDLIKVIVGSRRAGKSKLLELIMNELRENGLDNDKIIYVNFESIEYDYIKTYKDLYSYVLNIIGDGKYYIFLDEIQNVKNFEKAINSMRNDFNCSIFITGSNSKLLSGELATLLTGRTIEINVGTFSYNEALLYLEKNNIKKPDDFLEKYIKYGGYPLRFDLSDDKAIEMYLNELYNAIIKKDILKRNSDIENEKFIKVAKYVLANAGNEFNAKKITDFLNAQNKDYITIQTIYKYLEKMENAFLISPISKYQIKGKEVLKSNKKYYAIDNGLKTINQNDADTIDIGINIENILYNEFISRGYKVYIGKTYKGEVDFVVMDGNKKCFVQVSYLMSEKETMDREFKAFSCIKDPSPKYVLSLDKIDMSHDGITHINIEDYLTYKKDLMFS